METCKKVEKVAKFFCNNTDLTVDKKYTIYAGCLLHDIGRTKKAMKWNNKYTKKDHHKLGKEYLEENLLKKYDIIVSYIRGKGKMYGEKAEF